MRIMRARSCAGVRRWGGGPGTLPVEAIPFIPGLSLSHLTPTHKIPNPMKYLENIVQLILPPDPDSIEHAPTHLDMTIPKYWRKNPKTPPRTRKPLSKSQSLLQRLKLSRLHLHLKIASLAVALIQHWRNGHQNGLPCLLPLGEALRASRFAGPTVLLVKSQTTCPTHPGVGVCPLDQS